MFSTAVLFAGILSGWAALSYVHLRHGGLAVIAVGSPLPVLLAGYGLASRLESDLVAFLGLLACIFGVVCSQSAADRIARGICDGLAPREAIRRTFAGIAVPVLWVLAACGLSLFAAVPPYGLRNCLAALVLLLAASALAFGGGFLARALSFSEWFVAAANRARESRERWISRLSFVAERRWGLSVSGIGIVLGTIAVFGARSLRLHGEPPMSAMRYALIAAIAFAASAIALRNWRLALAVTLTLVFEGLFGLWAVSAGAMPIFSEDRIVFGVTLAIGAVPTILLASAVCGFLRDGDDIATALARALEQSGPGAVLACVTAAVPWFVATVAGGIVRFELAAALATIAGTILVFPAQVTAIHVLFPRYRSVEEVFGKR
jgi:hypothetical protein